MIKFRCCIVFNRSFSSRTLALLYFFSISNIFMLFWAIVSESSISEQISL